MTSPEKKEQRMAYDTLLAAATKKWRDNDDVPNEVIEAVTGDVMKAILLVSGSPINTVLRNIHTGATATRALDPEGIPIWKCAEPTTGRAWDVQEAILKPEDDWKCIWNPEKEGSQ